jgi:hypothetical protein
MKNYFVTITFMVDYDGVIGAEKNTYQVEAVTKKQALAKGLEIAQTLVDNLYNPMCIFVTFRVDIF